MLTSTDVKPIDGRLKRRVGSKYKKDASLSQYQQYAKDYCKATLCEVGLTERSNVITVTNPITAESKQAEQFRPVTKMHVSKNGYVHICIDQIRSYTYKIKRLLFSYSFSINHVASR